MSYSRAVRYRAIAEKKKRQRAGTKKTSDVFAEGARGKYAATFPPRPTGLNLLEWTLKYRAFLAPDLPFDIDNHRYLEALYLEKAKRITIKKSAQSGVSEYAVSRALYSCDVRDATVFYVMPAPDDVYDFSQIRFGPAIAASPYLQKLTVGSQSGIGGAERVMLKRIRNRFIVFRGANIRNRSSVRRLKSVAADIAIRDEVNEMSPGVAPLVRRRLGHSSIAEEAAASTPTYAGMGIDLEFDESDQKVWMVKCSRCNEYQNPTVENLILESDVLGRPKDWYGRKEGVPAYLGCHKCGGNLTGAIVDGEWVATYPHLSATHAGYHITKLITGLTPMQELVDSLFSTDVDERMQIQNQDFGLSWEPTGATVSRQDLDDCKRDYTHGRTGEITYAGVDVGAINYIVIRTRPDGRGERRQVLAREFASLDDIPAMVKRYRIRRLVIDANPETSKAREIQDACPRDVVWLAYYAGGPSANKKEEYIAWNRKEGTVTVDRTRALDKTFGRFYATENTIPQGIEGSVPAYYEHMMAQTRITRESTGGVKAAFYVNTKPDHFGHGENYCTIASDGLSVKREGSQSVGSLAVRTTKGWS